MHAFYGRNPAYIQHIIQVYTVINQYITIYCMSIWAYPSCPLREFYLCSVTIGLHIRDIKIYVYIFMDKFINLQVYNQNVILLWRRFVTMSIVTVCSHWCIISCNYELLFFKLSKWVFYIHIVSGLPLARWLLGCFYSSHSIKIQQEQLQNILQLFCFCFLETLISFNL